MNSGDSSCSGESHVQSSLAVLCLVSAMDLHELWLRNLKMPTSLPHSPLSFSVSFGASPTLRPPSVQQVSLNSLARKLVFYEQNFSLPRLGSFVYPAICAVGAYETA